MRVHFLLGKAKLHFRVLIQHSSAKAASWAHDLDEEERIVREPNWERTDRYDHVV